MIVRFEALSFEAGLDENFNLPYWYVFVGGDVGRSQYLTLQRGKPGGEDDYYDEDDGDRDRVYVEVNDQVFSGYDHVSRCEVSANGLTVDLARPLGLRDEVEGIEITFSSGLRPPTAFVEHLRLIFAGREQQLRVVDWGPSA